MRKVDSSMEAYLRSYCRPETSEMQGARVHAETLNLGGISLSTFEAQFIQNFVKVSGQPIKKAVEIGTLTGLSALHWIELLELGGKLWTLEKSPEHVRLAKLSLAPHLANGVCEIIEGDALVSLAEVSKNGPFDFVFIDGNKAAYLDYWKWASENCSSGGIIVADNVFLGGSVFPNADLTHSKFSAKQIRVMCEMTQVAFADHRFSTNLVPTAEGLLIARRN